MGEQSAESGTIRTYLDFEKPIAELDALLSGTLTDKIDPYLRPLYDALNEMMDPEIVPKLLAKVQARLSAYE